MPVCAAIVPTMNRVRSTAGRQLMTSARRAGIGYERQRPNHDVGWMGPTPGSRLCGPAWACTITRLVGPRGDCVGRETLSTSWRAILSLIGIVILLNIADHTLLTYMPTYLSQVLHMTPAVSLLIVVGVIAVMMALITSVGALSDRVGRRPVLLASACCFVLFSYPAFWLISRAHIVTTIAGVLLLGLFLVLYLGTEPSTLPAIFPAPFRYGGFAIGYNISTSLFGGTAPFLNTYLISVTGNDLAPAFYLIAAGLVSVLPILSIPETAGVSLRGTSRPGTAPQFAR